LFNESDYNVQYTIKKQAPQLID